MKTIEISPLCSVIFWVMAIIHSAFYTFWAFKIHLVSFPKDNYPRIIHQRWFNFLGSITGWLILWVLLPTLMQSFTNQLTESISVKEIILLLIALISLSGYLPLALFGIARSANELANKISN